MYGIGSIVRGSNRRRVTAVANLLAAADDIWSAVVMWLPSSSTGRMEAACGVGPQACAPQAWTDRKDDHD